MPKVDATLQLTFMNKHWHIDGTDRGIPGGHPDNFKTKAEAVNQAAQLAQTYEMKVIVYESVALVTPAQRPAPAITEIN